MVTIYARVLLHCIVLQWHNGMTLHNYHVPKYVFFWRFLINHSMFLIFNDTGRTAFKFGRFEYFFVFLRPVFWEIPKWRYIKMLLYYSRLFVWYIKYFKCLFQHYDVIQQHCEVTQPHSSIPPAVCCGGIVILICFGDKNITVSSHFSNVLSC